MGVLDDLSSTFNKGAAAAERSARIVRLKAQINEVGKRQQAAFAQLGESLYSVTREDEALRVGREALYEAVAACDAERESCLCQIDSLEKEAVLASSGVSAPVVSGAPGLSGLCAKCGTPLGSNDAFCRGCGVPMSEARPQASANASGSFSQYCMSCGKPLNDQDAFCKSCGTRVAR